MSFATTQRRDRILSELVDKNHVTVRDLALVMTVSEATVRRDLRTLADDGKLTLVHGGATLPQSTGSAFDAKHLRNLDAKKIIGALAANLVSDQEQVFLDSGTTCFEMAVHLRRRWNVSVILNSTRLALELQGLRPTLATNGVSNGHGYANGSGHGGGNGHGGFSGEMPQVAMTSTGPAANVNLIMLGGQYRPERMDTIGPIALSTLEQLRGFQCFIGADGLSRDFGPSACDIDSAHLYRLAVANARQTVLLVDHSKFDNASLFKIVDWPRISRLVTDQRPSDEWMSFFAQHNIEAIYPPEAPEAFQSTP